MTRRDQIVRHVMELWMLRVVTYSLPLEEQRIFTELLPTLPGRPMKELIAIEADTLADLRTFRERYGYRGGHKELLALLAEQSPGQYAYVVKHFLDSLFTNYGFSKPTYALLPPHARIAMDPYGTRKGNEVEIVLLEAMVFEDLAILWNSLARLESGPRPVGRAYKEAQALRRAIVKSAFNLIEAYVNGIAVDVLATRAVEGTDRTLLAEFDNERSRPRNVSLKDKLMKYPRIALGETHPRIVPQTNDAFSFVLAEEKRLRHALIHPTPRIDSDGTAEFREQVYLNLLTADVQRIVASVIELIRAIDSSLDGMFGTVTWWLFDLDGDMFPDAAIT